MKTPVRPTPALQNITVECSEQQVMHFCFPLPGYKFNFSSFLQFLSTFKLKPERDDRK